MAVPRSVDINATSSRGSWPGLERRAPNALGFDENVGRRPNDDCVRLDYKPIRAKFDLVGQERYLGIFDSQRRPRIRTASAPLRLAQNLGEKRPPWKA